MARTLTKKAATHHEIVKEAARLWKHGRFQYYIQGQACTHRQWRNDEVPKEEKAAESIEQKTHAEESREVRTTQTGRSHPVLERKKDATGTVTKGNAGRSKTVLVRGKKGAANPRARSGNRSVRRKVR